MRAVVLIAVAIVACGDDGAQSEPDPPSPARPRLVNATLTDPNAPCTTGRVPVTSACVVPLEEEAAEVVDTASTTKDGCTQLYVASRTLATSTLARVRRYRMTGVSPCGFARDESFAEVTTHLSAIAASNDGAVYALGHRVVRRLAPGPIIDCIPRGLELRDQSLLAVAEDGRTGYVVWNRNHEPQIGRLVLSAETCALEPLQANAPPRLIREIAVDRVGQLHILESDAAYVLGGNGTLLDAYDPLAGRPYLGWPSGLRPCGDGTCLTALDSVFRRRLLTYGADGRLLGDSEAAYVNVGAGGPLFSVEDWGLWVNIVGMP